MSSMRYLLGLLALVCLAQTLPLATPAHAQASQSQGQDDDEEDQSGNNSSSTEQQTSSRERTLIDPTSISDDETAAMRESRRGNDLLDANRRLAELPEPGEFETYVEEMIGYPLKRFGADLLLPEARDFALPQNATVPADYRVNPGDVIVISLAGAVEGSVERTVDRTGQIFLPSVGSIQVAGVRQGDLREHLARAIGTQFRNFRVGVRVEDLNGIRVFVTGFANNPGSFTLSNLSTVSNAVLQAGGPSAGGSFRRVLLIRDGHQVAEFDLYDLLLNGSRASDPVLENEDVLFIPPAGEQVAVFGSVNQEAIYELRGGEDVADVVALAGGRSTLGEPGRAFVYRANRGANNGPLEIVGPALTNTAIVAADLVQVLPQGSLAQPRSQQSIVVTVEGEVARPGNYFLPASATLNDAIAAAGGATDAAFPFGTVFERQSIRDQQRVGYEDALRQFEIALASAPLTANRAIDAGTRDAQIASARATLERLRELEPDGRLVLAVDANSATPPLDLRLENADRIMIPARPSSVGVYGAVYRPASFQVQFAKNDIGDYVDRAGGVTRAGDRGRMFVIRANGEVLPRNRGAMNADALPGDVVFVPIRTTSVTLLDRITQFAALAFQVGITAATVAAIN
jgi:polysaccharide export outer membrane protein